MSIKKSPTIWWTFETIYVKKSIEDGVVDMKKKKETTHYTCENGWEVDGVSLLVSLFNRGGISQFTPI